MFKGSPRTVTTITPHRISFIGGGTDLPAFTAIQDGEVISSTINQYVYVTVKKHSPLFGEKYRLSYYKTEHANELGAIENGIARECLRIVDVEHPLYIATASDLPSSSGLGSSSSFAVGLLNALHQLKGENVCAGQLAEEACDVEINILGHPIGKQDQYAAAHGGVNHFRFCKNNSVHVKSLSEITQNIDRIFEQGMLVWTGVQRDANTVLRSQVSNIEQRLEKYVALVGQIEECKKILALNTSGSVRNFGLFLNKIWEQKRDLDPGISTTEIDELYRRLLDLGFYGGKLSGAGGGGFIFGVAPKARQKSIINSLGHNRVIRVKRSLHGSRVLSMLRD
jgi:D-glycero-alpha-D-manno-heptose-7-phosphate kinase